MLPKNKKKINLEEVKKLAEKINKPIHLKIKDMYISVDMRGSDELIIETEDGATYSIVV